MVRLVRMTVSNRSGQFDSGKVVGHAVPEDTAVTITWRNGKGRTHNKKRGRPRGKAQ